MRSAKDFFKPKALGAPEPLREIPVTPSRMIHFFNPANERMRAKVPELAGRCDVLLGNLEDAIPADDKIQAREGLVKVANEVDLGDCQLWTRVNSLDSPWCLDDLTLLVQEIGDRLDVIMIPKVEGAWDIHYVDQLVAQLEARAAISRMKTTRVGGGHPGYLVREDPEEGKDDSTRAVAQQDLWHYTLARMVDACAAYGILPYYGPFGDIKDELATEDQFRNAFLMGCVGAWSLHPVQIEIAKKVFSPPVEEVLWAKNVIEQMGDGSGAVMIDGKMQDDATYKQCKVMVGLAELLAEKDPELKEKYGFLGSAQGEHLLDRGQGSRLDGGVDRDLGLEVS